MRCLFVLLVTVTLLAPGLGHADEADWLPDLAALHEAGWQDTAWTTHRNQFRARKAGFVPQVWVRWELPPRPGDRSLLVREQGGVRTALVFHEAKGLVRVEILSSRTAEEATAAVQEQLGEGVAPEESAPLDVQMGWVDHLTIVTATESGSAVIVEAPRAVTDRVQLLAYEPWDLEGAVAREAAQARLAIGIPLLATSFVGALVLLPFATKQPAASLAVAGPLGVGISIGTALTISGAVKLKGALPKAELDAWKEAEQHADAPTSNQPDPAPGMQ